MNPNQRRRAAVAVAVAVAAVLVVAVVVVGWWLYNPDAGTHSGSDADHTHTAQEMPAEEVAQQVMGQIYTWSPAAQESPWDSIPPVAGQLTGPLAAMAQQRPANEPLPKQWLTWAEDNSRIVAATEVADSSGDDTHKSVDVVVKQRVMHADGDITPLEDMTAVVDMTRGPAGWQAAQYHLEFKE